MSSFEYKKNNFLLLGYCECRFKSLVRLGGGSRFWMCSDILVLLQGSQGRLRRLEWACSKRFFYILHLIFSFFRFEKMRNYLNEIQEKTITKTSNVDPQGDTNIGEMRTIVSASCARELATI